MKSLRLKARLKLPAWPHEWTDLLAAIVAASPNASYLVDPDTGKDVVEVVYPSRVEYFDRDGEMIESYELRRNRNE